MNYLWIENDNLVTLDAVASIAANSLGYINTASVTATLVLSGTSTQVSGQAWPTSFSLVSSETGTWQTTLSSSLQVTESQYYQLTIDIWGGSGLDGTRQFPLQARVRES